jgi:hypothetical protein
VANGRKSRNFILSVRVGDNLITDQRGKEEAFFYAYELNLEALGLRLSELEAVFTNDEVWSVIKGMPKERAPGPDGFIGSFFQKAWRWIKRDVMAAVHKLYVGDDINFDKLNRAMIVLIPKMNNATEIGDYRPLSLIHSFAKLFAKLLAISLRPRMGEIISANQSIFIKLRAHLTR